jgi:hypothetical protein
VQRRRAAAGACTTCRFRCQQPLTRQADRVAPHPPVTPLVTLPVTIPLRPPAAEPGRPETRPLVLR